MTEEEKKAIEDLKEEIKGAEYEGRGNDRIVLKLKTLLNLIERQQQEIEEKAEQIENLEMEHSLELIGKEEEIEANMREIIEKYYIPKDAIREKIKELIPIIKKYEQQRENDEDTDLTYEEVRKYACKVEVYKELLGEKYMTDKEYEKKWAKQRAKKGYCDIDLWNIDCFIQNTLLKMLKEFRKSHHCYPMCITSEEWDNILDRMIFLLTEMDEETCSMKIDGTSESYAKRTKYINKCKDEFYDLLKEYHFNLWD